MAVAVAVASGLADAGLGIRQAAVALGLDFVPQDTEDYDLVLLRSFAETEAGARLLDTIRSSAFRAAVDRLAGYSTEHTGEERPLGATDAPRRRAVRSPARARHTRRR